MADSPGFFQLLSMLGDHPESGIGKRSSDPLVEISDLKAVISAVECINDFPFNMFGFECTLQPGVKKVDFSFSLTRETAENAIAPGRPLQGWFSGNAAPGLKRVKSLLAEWLNSRSLLYHSIYSVYLELDTSKGSGAEIPGLFVRLHSGNDRAEWYETISFAVLYSAGIELTRTRREMIRNFYRCFTPVSEFFHLGIMLSRNDCPLKMVAMYISAGDAVEMLNSLGIDIYECVSVSDWETIVRFTSGKFGLSLDFTDRLHKRIGIEIEHSERDGLILDWLVEKGCCSIEKRNAVLDWSCEFSIPSSGGNGREVRIKRSISHFKLVLQPELPIMAKVYFAYECL